MKIENIRPDQIEAKSFEIIGEILGDKQLDPRYEAVIKRCIHTSADFEYADSMYFTEGVIAVSYTHLYRRHHGKSEGDYQRSPGKKPGSGLCHYRCDPGNHFPGHRRM